MTDRNRLRQRGTAARPGVLLGRSPFDFRQIPGLAYYWNGDWMDLAPGTAAGTMQDYSGHDNNLTQSTSSKKADVQTSPALNNEHKVLVFDTSDDVYRGAAPVIEPPFALFAWYIPGEDDTNIIMSLSNSGATNQQWRLTSKPGVPKIAMEHYDDVGGFSDHAEAAMDQPLGSEAFFIVGVVAATDDRRIYGQGLTYKGTNTVDKANPTGVDRLSVGDSGDSTPTGYVSMSLLEAGLVNRAPSENEIKTWFARSRERYGA